MTQTADFFDRRDSYRGAFFAATALHVAIVLVVALPAWLAGKSSPFGDANAGGAIGIGVVDKKETPKDAIRLKGRDARKKESRRLPSFAEIAQNQVTSSQPQALKSEL